MSIINNSQLLSGISIQQSYRTSSLIGSDAERVLSNATGGSLSDTVEISSSAYDLYNGQTATTEETGEETGEIQSEAGAGGGAPVSAAQSSSSSATVEDQIDALKEQIARVEEEIAALQERAEDDDSAAQQLQAKQAELMELQASLTELLTEQLQSA